MKAYDFFEDAMKLLGYTDFEGEVQDTTGLKERAVAVINRTLGDLEQDVRIKRLSDEITLSEKAADATVYGDSPCVVTIDGSELPRGGGGARCMTMPLSRNSIL